VSSRILSLEFHERMEKLREQLPRQSPSWDGMFNSKLLRINRMAYPLSIALKAVGVSV